MTTTTKQDLVDAVKDHALKHYNEGGWDYVVECYTDEDILAAIGRATTVAGSVKKVGERVGVKAAFRDEVIAAGDPEASFENCQTCGLRLNLDKGEAFLTDDGGIFCNDHAPQRDEVDEPEVIDPHVIDLDEVVRLVIAQGVTPASVDQTGGGTATIVVGEPDPERGREYGVAMGGPGWFDGPWWTKGRADVREFSIAEDREDFAPVYFEVGVTPQAIADALVAIVRDVRARETQDPDFDREREAFLARLREFVAAGNRLCEVWDGFTFHADEWAPLPADLRPPASLDEWLADLSVHYERTDAEGSR